MKRRLLGICMLVLTLATASNAVEVGQRFPDFTLKDLSGRPVSFSQFRGKVILLDFWMTTCPPCKKEMPVFQELQQKYAAEGFVVVGVSMDDKASTALKFARRLKVKYTLLLDPMLMTTESEQQRFGIVGLPTTYLIDREGIVRKKVVGFEYKESFESAVQELLRR